MQQYLLLLAYLLIAALAPVGASHPGDGKDVARILIYGASGRIGQHIFQEALDRGYLVTGVSRDANRLQGFGDSIDVEEGDILDTGQLAELMALHDAVIVSVGGPSADNKPENYIAVRAAASLISVLRRLGDTAPRVIFVGNLFTLDYEDGKTLLDLRPIDETHEYYAMFHGHQIALDMFRENGDLPWTVATPPNGLRLEGKTEDLRWGGDTLLRDPDGRPSEISREDFAYAIFEELENRRYIGRRFNVATRRDSN